MKKYIKYRSLDWILCILISIGLTVNVFSGFEMTDKLSSNIVIIAIVTAAAQLIFFMAAFNKKTTISGIIIGVLMLILAVIYFQSQNPFIHDKSDSIQIFWIVAISVALMVFLAARTRPGTILLFLTGNIVIAAAYFLKFPVMLWGYVLFLFSAALMLLYRVYFISLLKSHAGKVRFGAFICQSGVICLIAMLSASLIYIGVIKPLNPKTDKLKLITKVMSMKTIEKIGIYSVMPQTDYQKVSENKPNNTRTTNQQQDNKKENNTIPKQKVSASQRIKEQMKNGLVSKKIEKALAIKYDFNSYWYIYLTIIILFLIASPIVLKEYLRKKWYEKVKGLSKEAGIVNLYNYFMDKFSKIHYKKPVYLTLSEYAVNMKKQMEVFAVGNSNFTDLTRIYVKVFYGHHRISDEEYKLFLDFYEFFHKNIRKEIGNFRYLIKYFSL